MKKIISMLFTSIFMISFLGCSLNSVEIPELNLPEKSQITSNSENVDKNDINNKENSDESSSNNSDTNKVSKNESKSNKQSEKLSSDKQKEINSTSENGNKKISSNECTLTIRCDTAINNGVNQKSEFSHLPSDGIILPVTTVEIKDGDTVYDILQRTVMKNKIHMEYTGVGSTIYIQGINNLYEFDGGRWSGWMYCVNDWYPNYGCGSYTVKPGDVIQWNYTCDLGEDLGQHWLDEDIREKEK